MKGMADDPQLNHGGPVCLQLVARKLEEEKLLGMVKVVSNIVSPLRTAS